MPSFGMSCHNIWQHDIDHTVFVPGCHRKNSKVWDLCTFSSVMIAVMDEFTPPGIVFANATVFCNFKGKKRPFIFFPW
jgi:hypothetical protein